MSSTTKKVRIDPKSRKIVDELRTTDDLYRDVAAYERQLKKENERSRKSMAKAINEIGGELINEVEIKHRVKEEQRIIMIERIHKLTGEKLITRNESIKLSIEELKPILIISEEKAKPWYMKFLDFLMNWEDIAD